MAQKAKIVLFIIIILFVISLIITAAGIYLLQKERLRGQELENKLNELSAKQEMTESRLEETKKKASGLETKLQQAQSQIQDLNTKIEKEAAARQEALTKIEQLRVDLGQQQNLRAELESKLSQTQEDLRKAQSQMKELDTKKTELEAKVKELEVKSEGIELGKIVVNPEPAAVQGPVVKERAAKAARKQAARKEQHTQPSGLEGKVLVVNKEYNFVVINLGSQDGIKIDSELAVYHNNKYITDAKVEKLHDSMAAAGLLEPELINKVSEGDKVVQKVK